MTAQQTRPRVTALIDTYNHERFLAEAIESVLAQDFPLSEMEILVVDDGSTDSTPQVAARYSDRVRYIRKENGGQASALNLGFAEAHGEFIAMLDGDDVWLPQKLRRISEIFEQHAEAGMVVHPYQYWFPEEGRAVDDLSFVPLSGFLPDSEDAILRFGGVGTCSTALRTEVARRLLPLPESLKVFADSYLLPVAIFSTPLVGIKEHLTRYRHHGSNLAARGAADPASLRRSNASFRSAIEETRRWFQSNGFFARGRAAALLVERMELVEELQQFALSAPGRREFFGHLRRYHRLYAPIWAPGFRLFSDLKTGAGFVLGYHRFYALQQSYRLSPALPFLREMLVPAGHRGIAARLTWGRSEPQEMQ